MLIRGFQCSFDIELQDYALPPDARLKAVFGLSPGDPPIVTLTTDDDTITIETATRLRFHFSPAVSAAMPQSVIRFDFMRLDTVPPQHFGWEGQVQFVSTMARP